MSADRPRVIVFDLGGVLLDWDPRYLYGDWFDDPAELERFLTVVCPPEWNRLLDAGADFPTAVAERVARFPDYADAIEAYWTRWGDMLRGPIEGTVAVLEALARRGRQRLAALSNWSAQTFPLARARYDFLARLDPIVLSGEEKCVKPDPVIYRRLLARLGEPAEACLFIDDVAENVAAAARLGFQTVHFTGPEALVAALEHRGVL
ncbi:MAG: hydrolase [Gammaproteobacteria bacterium]|nr:MAG: hydrolase [Gammaproteobacteria bacterium]